MDLAGLIACGSLIPWLCACHAKGYLLADDPRLIYFGVLPEPRSLFAVMDRRRRNKANPLFNRADGKPWIN